MGQKTRNAVLNFLKYGVAKPLAWTLLDYKIKGRENLPEDSSAVLACHHCIGIDGIILDALLPKKIHFLVQYENIFDRRWPKLARFFEQVPLQLEEERRENGLNEAVEQCGEYYLADDKKFFGVMTDGPSKELKKDGEILRLAERPNYGAAVRIAWRLNQIAQAKKRAPVPVVPIAIKVSDEIGNELWQWASGKVWRNLGYIWKNRPVKYGAEIGKPFYTEDYKGRLVEMNRQIKLEQIRLHERL